MFRKRPFRAEHLVQWNLRQSIDSPNELQDKVVEAVLHHQGITFEHTNEYRSVYSYDKLCEQLEHYDSDFVLLAHNAYAQAGSKQAFRIFARPSNVSKLKTVSLTQEAAILFERLGIKGDKSAGLTAYGESKMEAFTVGLDKAVKILTSGKSPAPCLAGVRTQRKGKTRLVWMYPLEITILEAIIARPLINHFKGIQHVMTFGDFSHETGMRLRNSVSSNKYHYSLDQSQFDASVNPFFIQCAFNAFRTWFDLDTEVYPGVTLAKVFDVVERYFICTPIVMPTREKKYPTMVTGKRGGVPSGSYFTQIVDSFANVAGILGMAKRLGIKIKDKDLYVLGDDCLFFCNSNISLHKIAQVLAAFGFKLNVDKSRSGPSTDDVEYLGRTWRNGFPIRPFSRLTRGALYPEKYRRYSPDMGKRFEQALNCISSYLLTSYVEDLPVGVEQFGTTYVVSPTTTSGITQYLMETGLIPGKVMKRAIF